MFATFFSFARGGQAGCKKVGCHKYTDIGLMIDKTKLQIINTKRLI